MTLRDQSNKPARLTGQSNSPRDDGDMDERRKQQRATQPLPAHDAYARDHAFNRSIGFTVREGILWDEAWMAARHHYLARIGTEQDARA
jgi:hypothetical protein